MVDTTQGKFKKAGIVLGADILVYFVIDFILQYRFTHLPPVPYGDGLGAGFAYIFLKYLSIYPIALLGSIVLAFWVKGNIAQKFIWWFLGLSIPLVLYHILQPGALTLFRGY